MGDLHRHVLLHQDEAGRWVAQCPSLPAALSDGATQEEALLNIREAIALTVQCMRDDGEAIPDDFAGIHLVEV